MSTVAFLASVVDPRVASSAAKAALGKKGLVELLFLEYCCGAVGELAVQYSICGVIYLTFFSAEEFSRVQEESVDKMSEMSNQPEKIGKS